LPCLYVTIYNRLNIDIFEDIANFPKCERIKLMKKFLAFFLACMVVFSMSAMFTSVGAVGHDANDIPTIDYFDFSPENNKWAERDAEGNLVHTSFNDNTMIKDELTGKYYYPHALYLEDNAFNNNLNMEFMQGGEVLRLTATDEGGLSTYGPGIAFGISTLRTFNIGKQDDGNAEYVKIRLKNNSPSTKLTFMGTNESWGAGKLDQRIRATIELEPNSSEWQTITISMIDGTLNTTGSSAWNSYLKNFAIFPFGYNKENEAIINDKYYVEIDYVVIGSYEYVSSYQSALETKENSAIDFKFESQPAKKEYFLGETIDLTGLQASIKYGTDTEGNLLYPDEVVDGSGVSAVYNFDKPLKEDGTPIDEDHWTSTVTLMYGANNLTYDVTVYDIKDIEFEYETDQATDVDNKVYDRVEILRNGDFTPTGIKVKVNYAKVEGGVNVSAVKEMYEVDLIGTEFAEEVELSEGGYYEYLVTVNYHGHVLYLPVKLIDIAELVITPVEEKAGAIYYGTVVDASFFEVNCKYTNGDVKLLEDTGLTSYLSISCNTKTTGGNVTATLNLVNSAYNVDVTKDVTVTVQTPVDIEVKLKKTKFDTDEIIGKDLFTITYTYADGETAVVEKEDPNLVFNYDTTTPGTDYTGVVKIGDKRAEFKYEIKTPTIKEGLAPVDRGGAKVDLLAPKFPTFWLVTIIVVCVVAAFVGLWALLKFVFKVDFKRKKRVSLDDIF